MSGDRVPPIGSVPIYEKSQRKSHITGKIYILLIIAKLSLILRHFISFWEFLKIIDFLAFFIIFIK
jgi:hypothetical protein